MLHLAVIILAVTILVVMRTVDRLQKSLFELATVVRDMAEMLAKERAGKRP